VMGLTKQELTADLKRFCGGASFCKRKQLADYLGYQDPHCVDRFLSGLEKVGASQFYIPDVVERILER